ncbi:ABC transporter permease [Isachenkonia alkalipeptolytica]|uniref:Transport permease protein n=1 Tax=Isachenkonia alkalipeptolytica TaxID=2565777 RepID=A0AA43XJQ7_9CLOT|nr:ABC transporter permease [Isachenkonia alkalipeptolytica]NBG87140.1 ABC transporter permease [Isachenkonia alkalipeptolytica]
MNKTMAFWSILMKDMRNYYLKPPNISWGIIFPVSWTLMFFMRSGGEMDVRGILPGVMALSILFGTTSMLAVTITFERKSRSFERLLLAPISLNLLMLAKTTGAIFFGIVNAFVPVLFASFIIDLSGINWFVAIAGVVLIAITSTFLGLFIAVSVSEVFEAQTFSNFFRFPMMFLCGLFIPIASLPTFLQPLSYILPLTYGADMLRFSINADGSISIWISLLVLIGYSLALFMVSTHNIKKKWIY